MTHGRGSLRHAGYLFRAKLDQLRVGNGRKNAIGYKSSCLNPFIYGMSNKNYWRGYRKLFLPVCPRVLQASNRVTDLSDKTTDSKNVWNSRNGVRRIFVQDI